MKIITGLFIILFTATVSAQSPYYGPKQNMRTGTSVSKVTAANVVTFSELSSGTEVTNQYLSYGILFSGVNSGPSPQIYDFSGSYGKVLISYDWYSAIKLTFVNPLNASEYNPITNFQFSNPITSELDYVVVKAYNRNDELVKYYASASPENVSLSFATDSVAYIILDDSLSTAYVIDNISFSQEAVTPVELSSFHLVESGSSVVLKWETVSETNNAGWEVETKEDGKPETGDWKNAGFVAGKGTTTEKQNYSFTVSSLPTAVSAFDFRLKQIDFDGKFSYSKVIAYQPSENGKSREFNLIGNYPNPFNPETKIVFSLSNASRVKVVISNILGQEIAVLADHEFEASSRIEIPFNASNLASGLYFYSVTSGNQKLTRSMLLSK